jgi:hypothetical protein
MHCSTIFRLINVSAATYTPENSPQINRAHLLPCQWVFTHFSSFEYPVQLFPYFCGSAAVVISGRAFLPVNYFFRCVNPVQIARFSSPALRLDLRCPGITRLCKHNMYRQFTGSECPCHSQVVSFVLSQSHGLPDSDLSKIRPVEQGRAPCRNSFLLYIIIFYLVRTWNNICFIWSYGPALMPERSGSMACLALFLVQFSRLCWSLSWDPIRLDQ